jgi:hypothetical protein
MCRVVEEGMDGVMEEDQRGSIYRTAIAPD